MDTFAELITKERERLHKLRDDLFTQQSEITQKLTDIAKELSAIDAYEKAKGEQPKTTRARKTSRGSKREELLSLIRENPDITRGEIINKLNIKNDKPAQSSISNALTQMKAKGQVTLTDGKYRVPGV